MEQHTLNELFDRLGSGQKLPAHACLGWMAEEQKNRLTSLGSDHYSGKVREMVFGANKVLMLHTDRLSAFDKHICHIPCKGIILAQMGRFWFERLRGVIPNHYIDSPHQRVLRVKPATPFKIEVVVRGYMAGSMWRSYAKGETSICGQAIESGLQRYQKLSKPILTPSSKAAAYEHDENITPESVVSTGLATQSQWQKISEMALSLFQIGTQVYSQAGWILVDTKYEFGLDGDGNIMLIDEVHTPDSSRLWKKDTYKQRIDASLPPEMFDKEVIRSYLIEQGYMGEGTVPELPAEKKAGLVASYLKIYESLSSTTLALEEPWENVLISKQEQKNEI